MPPAKNKNTELVSNLDSIIENIEGYIDKSKLSKDEKKNLTSLVDTKKALISRVKALINGTKRKIPSNAATELIAELFEFIDKINAKHFRKVLRDADNGRIIKCTLLYYIFLTANAKRGINYGWGLSNFLYNLTFTSSKAGRPDGMYVDVNFVQAAIDLYDIYAKCVTTCPVMDDEGKVSMQTIKFNSASGMGTFNCMSILKGLEPIQIHSHMLGTDGKTETLPGTGGSTVNVYVLSKQALNSLIKSVLAMMRILDAAIYYETNSNDKKKERVEILRKINGNPNPIYVYIKSLIDANIVVTTTRPGDDKVTEHKMVDIFTLSDGGNIETGKFVTELTRMVRLSSHYDGFTKKSEQDGKKSKKNDGDTGPKIPTIAATIKFITKAAPKKPRKEKKTKTNVELFCEYAIQKTDKATLLRFGEHIRISNLFNVVAQADKVSHNLPATLYEE